MVRENVEDVLRDFGAPNSADIHLIVIYDKGRFALNNLIFAGAQNHLAGNDLVVTWPWIRGASGKQRGRRIRVS